jgi:hypothetical protein
LNEKKLAYAKLEDVSSFQNDSVITYLKAAFERLFF